MTKIPFTVYDIFAYVFSGGVVVTAIDYVFGYQWILNVEKSAFLAIFLIFLAYVSGHLVAHFSSFFLEIILVDKILKRPSRILMGENPPKILRLIFPGYYKPLPEATQQRTLSQAKSREFKGTGEALFLHAYAIVTKNKDSQNRLEEFRNLYGFARNMAFSFFVTAILLLIAIFTNKQISINWALVCIGIGLGMLYRYLKFFRQFSYHLLITYAEL